MFSIVMFEVCSIFAVRNMTFCPPHGEKAGKDMKKN